MSEFGEENVDPAADFLAREQNELAGLEDVVKPAAAEAESSLEKDTFDIEGSASLHQSRDEEPETEKIKIWKEGQIRRLEEKDKEEEKRKEQLIEQAKQELADWYRTQEEKNAKTRAANRNAEKQFVAEEEEIEQGTEWERIAKLCDFNAKSRPGCKDVSRMRSLILQMKQSPVYIKNEA